jgi:hypothetical protein
LLLDGFTHEPQSPTFSDSDGGCSFCDTPVLSTGYGCELEIDKEMKSIVTGNFNDWAVFDPSWKKPTGLFTSVSWLAF